MPKTHLKIILTAVAVFVIGGTVFFVNSSNEPNLDNTLALKGTEQQTAKPKEDKPVFLSSSFEPLKVKPGDKVIIILEIKDEYGVEQVTADMGGIETISLELIEGTKKQGTRKGTWLAYETEVKNYQTMITAVNAIGKESTMSTNWEDPTVTDTFSDSSKVAATSSVTVTGGVAKLTEVPLKGNGEACSDGSECESTFCVDGVCCNTACTGSTCQRCDSYSNAGAGTCGYVSTAEDPDTECAQGSTASDGCQSNNCSGSGYACGYQTSGDGGCPVCKTCVGASSQVCLNYTNNTQDTGCNGTCQACQSGSCSVADNTDWGAGTFGCAAGAGDDPNRCYDGSCINCGGWGNAGYCWYDGEFNVSCTDMCSGIRGGVYKGTCDWRDDPGDASTCKHWYPDGGNKGYSKYGPMYWSEDPGNELLWCYAHQDGQNYCDLSYVDYSRQCACNK